MEVQIRGCCKFATLGKFKNFSFLSLRAITLGHGLKTVWLNSAA